MLSIRKHASSAAQFPSPILRQIKTGNLMFPNIFSSIMTDSDKTGYFHSAANEAMKPIFFL